MGVRGLRNSISLSLLVHAFCILVCATLLSQRTTQQAQSKTTWIELLPLPAPKKAENLPIDSKKRQIVQTEKIEKSLTPAPDAFLGEQNQVVDHQSVSRSHDVSMAKASKPTLSQKAPSQTRETARTGQAQLTPQEKPLANFGLPIFPHFKELNEANEKDQPNWVTPGQLAQDYVKGMKESERTALNTREYVFYGYYQRIRERLDRAWVPVLRQKLVRLYRGGRGLASDMEHKTRVLVVLNQRGEIVHVKVLNESGNAELDDAAISAFNQAGPFPNPPRGIIDPQGEIQVPWEFILRT